MADDDFYSRGLCASDIENDDEDFENSGNKNQGSLLDEIKHQLKGAPWYLTSTAAHMVLLLLLMLIPTSISKRNGDIVIYTQPKIPEEAITFPEDSIQEPVVTTPQENIAEIVKELGNPEFTTESVVDASVDTNTPVDTSISFDELDDLTDIPAQDDIADSNNNPLPNVLGVKGASLSSRSGTSSGFRGSYANIGRSIKGIVGNAVEGGMAKGLCLVWLLDQSGSMKDDQLKIAQQARDIQDLLTSGGRRRMVSAVVTFGEKWQLTQPLTHKSEDITDAIMNVEVDRTGKENTCQAITWTCQKIMNRRTGWTKVIVLLSDESASDRFKRYNTRNMEPDKYMNLNISGAERRLPLLEVALKNLVKEKTRLFVIGKESPFQRNYVIEPYTDQNGKVWSLPASRGPETPFIEVPISNATLPAGAGGNFKGAALAGFGVYDLAYLAKWSKGAYFILDEEPKNDRPMSAYERARNPFKLDWITMDKYTPQLVARSQYHELLLKSGKQGRKVAQLNKYVNENKDAIRRVHQCRPSQHQHFLDTMRTRRELLVRLIETIANATATDEEVLESDKRRQMANIDLWYATLLADQIITDSWIDAFESFRGSISNEAPEGHHAALVLKPKMNEQLSKEEHLLFEDRMRQLTHACNEVIRRHSNTPYAICARWLVEGPKQWGRPFELIRVIRKNSRRMAPDPVQ